MSQRRGGDSHDFSGELIILVGMQGSGKSHYCKTRLADSARISQDEGPKTYGGVLRLLQQLLAEGIPRIVIDRTNPMRSQRNEFAALARSAGYRVRIIYFDVPARICKDRIRKRKEHPTLDMQRMNEAISRYLSVLDVPTPDECDELVVET